MMDVKMLRTLSKWLVLVGGLNWGLVGFFNYNLVQYLLGNWATYVYMLVGLSALWGTLAKLGVVSSGKRK